MRALSPWRAAHCRMGACLARPKAWHEHDSPDAIASCIDTAKLSPTPLARRHAPFHIVYSARPAAARYNAFRSALALQHSVRAAEAAAQTPFHCSSPCSYALFDLQALLLQQARAQQPDLPSAPPLPLRAAALLLSPPDLDALLQWLQAQRGAAAAPLEGAGVALYLLQGGGGAPPLPAAEARARLRACAAAVRALGGRVLAAAAEPSSLRRWCEALLDACREEAAQALVRSLSPLHAPRLLQAAARAQGAESP